MPQSGARLCDRDLTGRRQTDEGADDTAPFSYRKVFIYQISRNPAFGDFAFYWQEISYFSNIRRKKSVISTIFPCNFCYNVPYYAILFASDLDIDRLIMGLELYAGRKIEPDNSLKFKKIVRL